MKKILVIEDNEHVRENLTEILELTGYEVEEAENGKVGVAKAISFMPDLILCDVMMPELDGFGVLRILSKNTECAQIPFIFLTAKAEKTDFRKGMNLGADDYITKPFDDSELLEAVEMRLKKGDILKKKFEQTSEGLNAFIAEVKAKEALDGLAEERESRQFSKKTLVYEEGQYTNVVYFISKGKIKGFKTNAQSGKELITNLYKEGDFIGTVPAMKNEPYKESAIVLEKAELTVIPKEDFMMLLYNNRDVSYRFIKMLANNIQEKETQLIQLAYNSVRKRLADALLLLYAKYGDPQNEDFSISILRDDLASIVGTAKETVIRTLRDFKEEGLIKIKGSKITILNKEELKVLQN